MVRRRAKRKAAAAGARMSTRARAEGGMLPVLDLIQFGHRPTRDHP
jgi:hypothetical protein